MNISTLSSKYSVVIPKELRRQPDIVPGEKLNFVKNKRGILGIQRTTDLIDYLKGKFAGTWGDDPVAYVRKQLKQWDE